MLRIEEATTRRDTFIARGMGRSFQEGFTRVDAAIPLRVVTFAAGADAVDQKNPKGSVTTEMGTSVEPTCDGYPDDRQLFDKCRR
jgi:hypothetical protein